MALKSDNKASESPTWFTADLLGPVAGSGKNCLVKMIKLGFTVICKNVSTSEPEGHIRFDQGAQ